MATALVIGSILGGTGVAHAGATEIPKGFLLTEAKARKGVDPDFKDEEWWTVSDNPSRRLELNPCRTKGKPRDGRVAMRTITHGTSAPSFSSEQLVLYGNTKSAKAAFAKLQADLKRCPRATYWYFGKPLSVGDQAMSVAGYSYKKRKIDRSISPVMWAVARRGSALFFYTDFDDHANRHGVALNERGRRKVLADQAKNMAKKVCDLPVGCG